MGRGRPFNSPCAADRLTQRDRAGIAVVLDDLRVRELMARLADGYVLDDDRSLLPVGTPGHLYIGGDRHLMRHAAAAFARAGSDRG